jgi:hypothetical protein
MRQRLVVLLSAIAVAGASVPAVVYAGESLPRLSTVETLIDDVTRGGGLAIDDTMAIFAFVFGSLPERVNVYPTENYYYFHFHHGGVRYAGNIRLDRTDRDEGKLHFAYFQDATLSAPSSGGLHYELLGPGAGVSVEKVDRLVYRVSYRGKAVLFALNDLTGVKPLAAMLGPGERYLGPVFDESATRFFLVYSSNVRVFHYILDETVPPNDRLMTSAVSDLILIGRRTGFAYFQDGKLARKLLIGVLAANVEVNSYFDGPFDQLPDNFIDGEELRDAILDADPDTKGKIDRLGGYEDGASRYFIGPYKLYREQAELIPFQTCAAAMTEPDDPYGMCFDANKNLYFENDEQEAPSTVSR